MHVLVVYASRYGSTKGIAERIAGTLVLEGHTAVAAVADDGVQVEGYDAFVVGSAVYMGSWMHEASDFVRRNQDVLAKKPVWLFSSGPVGTRTVDDEGRDVRAAAVPKEVAVFETAIHPKDHHVFFGAMDHTKFGFTHRAVFALPAARKLLVEGDFRDWSEIEEWARGIAAALAPAHVT